MGAAHRDGDLNTANGVLNSVLQSTVFCNGSLISVDGSSRTSDDSCSSGNPHCSPNLKTANGSSNVFAEGVAVNYSGNADT